MKVLQVIECAYRATIEEQDDTIIWITHAMKGAGGDLNVLLRANAVNYAVKGQDASGLSFGDWQQTEPPLIADQVASLVGKGVEVYVLDEDIADRGLGNAELVEGIKRVARAEVPALMDAHDQIWNW
jgi:sulfur transfer complex TusBCD TusB component (DsrH family)